MYSSPIMDRRNPGERLGPLWLWTIGPMMVLFNNGQLVPHYGNSGSGRCVVRALSVSLKPANQTRFRHPAGIGNLLVGHATVGEHGPHLVDDGVLVDEPV